MMTSRPPPRTFLVYEKRGGGQRRARSVKQQPAHLDESHLSDAIQSNKELDGALLLLLWDKAASATKFGESEEQIVRDRVRSGSWCCAQRRWYLWS